MSNRKKITISQNLAESTTGQAPLREPFEYYLDIDGLDPKAAQDFIRKNRSRFPFIDEEAIALLSDEFDIESDDMNNIAVRLAQLTISGQHTDLPAPLGFGMRPLDSLDGIEGTKLDCFGMTLIESRRQ